MRIFSATSKHDCWHLMSSGAHYRRPKF
uniref:Uncharacterized protein n=1 Tax=Rhizophora mucronata TaxID=61149 RepID=A0A2P2N1K7_RHIMU